MENGLYIVTHYHSELFLLQYTTVEKKSTESVIFPPKYHIRLRQLSGRLSVSIILFRTTLAVIARMYLVGGGGVNTQMFYKVAGLSVKLRKDFSDVTVRTQLRESVLYAILLNKCAAFRILSCLCSGK